MLQPELIRNAEKLMSQLSREEKAFVYQTLHELGSQLPSGSMVALLDLKVMGADWPESLQEAFEQVRQDNKEEALWALGLYIHTPHIEIASVQVGSSLDPVLVELKNAAMKAVNQISQNSGEHSGQREHQISEMAHNPSKFRLH